MPWAAKLRPQKNSEEVEVLMLSSDTELVHCWSPQNLKQTCWIAVPSPFHLSLDHYNIQIFILLASHMNKTSIKFSSDYFSMLKMAK